MVCCGICQPMKLTILHKKHILLMYEFIEDLHNVFIVKKYELPVSDF